MMGMRVPSRFTCALPSLVVFAFMLFVLPCWGLPGGNLAVRTPVFMKLFAGKYQEDWGAKVKFCQTIDEQWIMLVGGLPANWSNNCTQTLTEKAPFHVSAKYVLRWWAQRFSLFLRFAKRWEQPLKSLEGLNAMPKPSTEGAHRQLAYQILTNIFRGEI
jgi:hypothetical protein